MTVMCSFAASPQSKGGTINKNIKTCVTLYIYIYYIYQLKTYPGNDIYGKFPQWIDEIHYDIHMI